MYSGKCLWEKCSKIVSTKILILSSTQFTVNTDIRSTITAVNKDANMVKTTIGSAIKRKHPLVELFFVIFVM